MEKMSGLTLSCLGRTFSIEGSSHDLSVVGSLKAANGSWEPHITAVMERYIREDSVCFDIGANVGVFSLVMGAIASSGHVYAFEPSSRNFGFLRQNLDGNRITNVTPSQTALWHANGEVDFFYIEELAGCAFVDVPGNRSPFNRIQSVVTQPWMNEGALHCQHERVHCQRLDDFVVESGISRLDLIKLDVEGAEISVIAGAHETLLRFRPFLVTEFNPACMRHYFDIQPSAYFEALGQIYSRISVIEESGTLTAADFSLLSERIESGKGWEDLFCQP